MPDHVWIIAGGLLQVPAVEVARSLGLRAIVTDRNWEAPAMRLADRAYTVDIYDVGGHLLLADELLARGVKIAGVFTEGADVEVTVAAVADRLRLPGIPVKAAENCKNKARMRKCLEAARLNGLRWQECRTMKEAEAFARQTGYPFMVKAVDNCASRGTRRVDDPHELETAFENACANSTTGSALLEELLEGDQQSVEIMLDGDGHLYRLNIVDRPFDGVLELGHVNPSRLPRENQMQLFALTEEAAGAVGVEWGVFKADTIWTADGPRILEVTARLSGGFDCQYTTPLATGRNFIRAAMRLACAMPLDMSDLTRKHDRYAAAWTAFPPPGRVMAINGVEKVREKPGVAHVFLRVKVGDVIEPYEHCATRPAFVIAVGATYQEAMYHAQSGARELAEGIQTE